MAESYQISVKDRESAMSWLNMVTQINEDYHVAMKEASECLVEMQNFAEGTLVDDIVKLGTDLLNAGETIFGAISSIADTVTNIISKLENFVGDAVNTITNAIGSIFG